MKPQIYVYRRQAFFTDEFPFSIRHVVNRSEDFNEQKRFQREFWKITYILDGQGEFILDNATYPIHPKSIFLVHPGALTTFRMNSEAMDLYNIVFDPSLIEHELAELKDNFQFFSIFSESFHQEESAAIYIQEAESDIDALVKNMERELEYRRSNYQVLLKWKLMELLVLLLRKGEQKVRARAPERIVEYANNMLEKYYHEDIRLSKLAANIGVTPSHLCRLYKKYISVTVSERLREIRLKHAAESLVNSSKSISEIIFESGYNDLSYFYRSFIDFYGCNPGDYRKKFGLN